MWKVSAFRLFKQPVNLPRNGGRRLPGDARNGEHEPHPRRHEIEGRLRMTERGLGLARVASPHRIEKVATPEPRQRAQTVRGAPAMVMFDVAQFSIKKSRRSCF